MFGPFRQLRRALVHQDPREPVDGGLQLRDAFLNALLQFRVNHVHFPLCAFACPLLGIPLQPGFESRRYIPSDALQGAPIPLFVVRGLLAMAKSPIGSFWKRMGTARTLRRGPGPSPLKQSYLPMPRSGIRGRPLRRCSRRSLPGSGSVPERRPTRLQILPARARARRAPPCAGIRRRAGAAGTPSRTSPRLSRRRPSLISSARWPVKARHKGQSSINSPCAFLVQTVWAR